jgi:hypothetical protein
MICSKCVYYAPLVGRSYNLSKCLKLQQFVNVARDTCKGDMFFPKTIDDKYKNMSLSEIKNKDKR